jgi:hypothetical protein
VDPQSGASLFCTAKAAEIFRFRSRMNALLYYSVGCCIGDLNYNTEEFILTVLLKEVLYAHVP